MIRRNAMPIQKGFKKQQSGQNQNFPGQKLGWSMDQTKEFVNSQIKGIGFTQQLIVGLNKMPISLPGDAAFFLGMAFDSLADATFTLNINGTIVQENVAVIFATVGASGGLGQQPYYGINMPVSGQDSVTLSVNVRSLPPFPAPINILAYHK